VAFLALRRIPKIAILANIAYLPERTGFAKFSTIIANLKFVQKIFLWTFNTLKCSIIEFLANGKIC
jgi:hypothetical protein